jgi:hypothetical protein
VTLAILFAIDVTAALAVAVFAIWSGGSGPNGPQGVAPAPQGMLTPTPRTVHWPRPTTAAPAGSGSPAAGTPVASGAPAITPNVANVPAINAVAQPAPSPSPTAAPSPTSAPEPTAEPTPSPSPAPTAPPTPSATPTPEPAFVADDAASFSPLLAGGWTVSGNELAYDSPQAQAEPLLLVPYQTRSGDFAIEAEIKVNGLAQGVCNQSFGVVTGSPATGLYWGGGIIYSCGSSTPAARITDVSNWTNGYDQDRQLARANFDPDEEWHRYRLEVRGNELRLLIDGEEILTATDPALQGGRTTGQTGLWTQGTRLSVRRLAIHEL